MLLAIDLPGSAHHRSRWCSKRDVEETEADLLASYTGQNPRVVRYSTRYARQIRYRDGSRVYPDAQKVRVSVDWECHGETWWDAARAAIEGGEVAAVVASRAGLLTHGRHVEIVILDWAAERLRAWCESLPGWSDGPAFALHPLRFEVRDPVNGNHPLPEAL